MLRSRVAPLHPPAPTTDFHFRAGTQRHVSRFSPSSTLSQLPERPPRLRATVWNEVKELLYLVNELSFALRRRLAHFGHRLLSTIDPTAFNPSLPTNINQRIMNFVPQLLSRCALFPVSCPLPFHLVFLSISNIDSTPSYSKWFTESLMQMNTSPSLVCGLTLSKSPRAPGSGHCKDVKDSASSQKTTVSTSRP